MPCSSHEVEAPNTALQTVQSSDERAVVVGVHTRLHESPYLQLKQVDCEFRSGVLTLRGTVSSYHMKQVAQTLALGAAGVADINNQVEVVWPPRH